MKTSIEIDDKALRRQLRHMINAGKDMSPAMRQIAGVLEDASERAFENQTDPFTGTPWAPLSPVTIKRRSGQPPYKILQDTGQLAASITSNYGRDFAEVGTNKIYARTQFFDITQGQFGTASNGSLIPWGDIPARRFMGYDATDQQEMLDILKRLLLG